jgi:hypothetical protein
MLKSNQLEAIDYLIAGVKTREEIAKCTGVSDRTVYRWLENDEFKAEWRKRADEYKSQVRTEVSDRMFSKLGMVMDNIIDLANNSASEKIKLDANVFIWESQLGKATTRIEQSNTDTTSKSSDADIDSAIDSMINELDIEDNNVIDIKKAK